MCKYCLRAFAPNDQFQNFGLEKVIEFKCCDGRFYLGLDMRTDDDDDNNVYMVAQVGALDIAISDDAEYSVKIHYCPFCGQKLDLVEVDE